MMMMTGKQVVTVEDTAAVVNPFGAATVADWIRFCDVKAATQRTYDKAVKSFVGYLANNGIEQPQREDVIAYRKWMVDEDDDGNSGANAVFKVSTARLYLVVVKKFFRWLSSKMFYPNVAADVKLPQMGAEGTEEHAHDALTLTESRQVISSFKTTDEKTLRDKCIMSLMLCSGLRSIEVVRLDIGDWEKRRGIWFIKVHGKGRAGKVDSVQISEPVKAMIDEYLSVRPKGKKGTPLFISTANRNRGQRLQTQTVSRLAKKTFANVGIVSERITCHSCRATSVTLMLEAGVPIREVQRVMRHRSPVTTEIYANDISKYNNRGVKVLSNLLFAA